MALAVTGQSGSYAISTAMTKVSANSASGPGLGNGYPTYHISDAGGQPVTMRVSGPSDGPAAASNGPSSSTTVLEFVAGGQSGGSLLRLTQQNCVDLVAAIVGFANTGTLS